MRKSNDYGGVILTLPENIAIELHDVFLYYGKMRRVYTPARDFSVLSLRLSGECVFYLGERACEAPTGSVTYIPAGHGYTRVPRREEEIAVFHFTVHGVDAPDLAVYVPQDKETCRALFLEALRLFEEKPIGYRYAATAVFYRILSLLSADGAPSATAAEGLAARAARLIGRRFADPALSIAAVAETLYVSEAYLRRVFHKEYGKSPKAYLSDVRIAHAESLLETGYYSQKEVAERCGYSDVKYFRIAFAEKTGETPSAYAKRCQGETKM